MKWLLMTVLALAAIAALTAIIGSRLPVAHRAVRQATFSVPPETVWTAITDIDAFPSWREGVKRVERLPARGGRTTWREDTSDGRLTLVTDRIEPPRLLVVRIGDPDLPFGGTWTYEVDSAPGGATLTITENGEVYNPIFRALARFVFGHERTIRQYLASLERHLRPKFTA